MWWSKNAVTPTACHNFSNVEEESTKFDVMNREGQLKNLEKQTDHKSVGSSDLIVIVLSTDN